MGVLVAMTIALPAMGQSSGQQCAGIADDASRLACYDDIFRDGAVEPTANLVLESEQLIPARPSGRATASFRLACVEGELDVSFAFAGQQMSATGDITAITLQVDQGATQVRTLQASDDNTAVRFGSALESSAFLDTLAGGTTLKVRATPVRQRSLNVTFRLDAALPEITALRQSCVQAR
jgi:type VI secretion system protein VasI